MALFFVEKIPSFFLSLSLSLSLEIILLMMKKNSKERGAAEREKSHFGNFLVSVSLEKKDLFLRKFKNG